MKTNTSRKICLTISIFSIAFLLSRCNETSFKAPQKTDQPDLTEAEMKRLVLLDTNYTYSVANAKEDAITIAAELDAEDAKAGKRVTRAISQVFTFPIQDTIKYPQTDRSTKNDPGFHVFNFSDNNGFAIISGDKRAYGRLGWSGDGTMSDELHSNMIMTRMINYIQSKRQEVEAMRGDKDYLSLLNKLVNFKKSNTSTGDKSSNERTTAIECTSLPTYARTSQLPPSTCSTYTTTTLIGTSNSTNVIVPMMLKTQWNQITPYNNNYGGNTCDLSYDECNNSNRNYLAGCTEIAESQVIAYYYGKNSTKYGTNWTTIANTAYACRLSSAQTSMVSTLVKSVYDNYFFDFHTCVKINLGLININQQGTFTFPKPDVGISSTYGFVQGEWRSYNNSDLETSLIGGSPVLIYGAMSTICSCSTWAIVVGNILLGIPPGLTCVVNVCVPDPTSYHEWVIDGLRRIVTTQTYEVDPVNPCTCVSLPSYTTTSSYIVNSYTHNNWGWGGGGNGWYIEGAFGGAGYDDANSATTAPHTINNDDHIIAYITPSN